MTTSTHPIRYSRLGWVRLQVTNLETSLSFYTELFGLALSRREGNRAWLRCGDKPHDIEFVEGREPGLSGVGFELCDIAEVQTAYDHLTKRGYAPTMYDRAARDRENVEAGLRFANPDTGLTVDFYAGQAPAPEPFQPTVAKIERLGHVVLNVSSYADAHQFWVEDLGFEISDHVPGSIAFLRCWPNPLHHSFALLESATDGLNHVNFMVSDIDDIGQAMNRMKKADVPIVFGPGRHLPSTSIFIYFLDPDGMTVEYSFGMEEFEEEDARPPRELERKPEVLDTWGSFADPRFGKTGAIVVADA